MATQPTRFRNNLLTGFIGLMLISLVILTSCAAPKNPAPPVTKAKGPLAQKLDEKRAASLAKTSPEKLKMKEAAQKELAESGIVDRSLKIGQKAPDFTLPNATGHPVHLQSLLDKGPVVVTFYRGGWCPYCNIALAMLEEYLPEIKKAGGTLVAISPQTPDYSLSTAEKNKLTYEVLSDVGNKISQQYGLVFTIPEAMRPMYEKADLPARNGDNSFQLPLPATFVVNRDGTVVYAFVDIDYTKRAEPDDIVDALKSIR